MGGAAAIDGVKSLELVGKTKRIFPGGQETDFTSDATILMSGALRQELTLSFGKLTTVWTPRGAFTDMGDGPVLLPDVQSKELAKAFRRNLIGLLQGRKAPGFRAAALGPTAPMPGSPSAERVQISNGTEEVVVEIDPASGRIRAIRYKPEIVGGQEPKESLTEYSDYRRSGPIQYPYSTRTLVGGQVAQVSELEKVTVNGPVDESTFEPKTAPVPAEGANEPIRTETPAPKPNPKPTATPGPKS